MAMTKKEKAAMQAAIDRANLLEALREDNARLQKAWDVAFAQAMTNGEKCTALRADAERWKALYRRALNAANGLTNYVEDRPELSKIERKLVAIEAAARAALKEQAPNARLIG